MSLRRTLGLWQVSFTGVGLILGAGVYALLAAGAVGALGAGWQLFRRAAYRRAVAR
jgi:hypothetical protein